MTKEYREGFAVGRKNAEGFHKGTMNKKQRELACLSPYSRLTEPEKRNQWVRGRLDGGEDYWKDKESIPVYI